MVINKAVVIAAVLLTVVEMAAQNGTNSPYTRYGYGDLANRSFGAGRSMGGVGTGLRSSKQINPLNPASYSCMDSLTFLFDFGASAQLSWFNDEANSQRDLNGNVNYMAMQFPLAGFAAMSVGLLPYSYVGYKFGTVNEVNGEKYSEVYEGSGGLNQFYGGLSFNLWKKRLSAGFNVSYLFGEITRATQNEYSSENATTVYTAKMYKIGSATVDIGVQYVHPLTKTENLVLGLTYAPKLKLKTVTYETVSNTTITIDTIHGRIYELPTSYSFGLSYEKSDKLLLAADFSFQQWSSAKFEDRNEFNNRLKVAIGGELTPNLYSRPYFNRVRYRAGVNYTDSYIDVNGKGFKELGATVGAGFPVSDARSFINVSLEYVKIKPDYKSMIDENYFRFTLNYTFNELWFFKRKME